MSEDVRWASYGQGWSGAYLFGPEGEDKQTSIGIYKAEHALGCVKSEAVARYIVELHNAHIAAK